MQEEMRKKLIYNEKEVYPFKQKLRLSSYSTVSSNSQSCSVTDVFVDQHLRPPQFHHNTKQLGGYMYCFCRLLCHTSVLLVLTVFFFPLFV